MPQQPWWCRAATLTERLDALAAARAHGVEPVVTIDHVVLAQQVARRWRSVVVGRDGDRDPDRFVRRLALLGLTVDDLPALVAVDVPTPGWLATVHAVGAGVADHSGPVDTLPIDDDRAWADDAAVPFASLWRPWVEHAVTTVIARTDVHRGVAVAVARPLRAELVDLGASVALAALDTDLGRDLGGDRRQLGAGPYRSWVLDRLADGGARLYDEYPVLARALAIATDQWIDAVVEMLGRLEVDRAELVERFGFGHAPIEAMRAPGDAHHGGRRVMVLTDTAGARVVYKPRSLAPELVVRRVAGELRAAGVIDIDVVPECLVGEGYGWMRFVHARPPADEHERRALGRRAGAVTMVARTLGVTDLHDENVIIDGSVPWLVDLECLAHPDLVDEDDDHVPIHGESVVSTGLLPLMLGSDGGLDVAGFTATPGDRCFQRHWRWTSHGLGSIRRCAEVEVGRRDRVRVPFDVDSFELGMREASLGLRSLDVDLGAGVARVPRRLVVHSTSAYAAALDRATEPSPSRHGLLRSVELDVVARDLVGQDADGRPAAPRWRQQSDPAIRAALERLDVPRVVAWGGSTSAWLDDAWFEDVTVESGVDLVRRRQALLGRSDDRVQRAVFRLAIEHRFGTEHLPPDDRPLSHTFDRTDLEICAALADELAGSVAVDRLGRAQWVHATLRGARPSAAFCGPSLFDGTAGIAVFLAAMAAECDDAPLELLARRALGASLAAGPGPGLAGGTAGIAWACAIVGSLLDDPLLGREAVRLIREATWLEHEPTDLLVGRTGVLLAAASIAATTGDEGAAMLAAEHRRGLEDDWRAVDSRPPLGRTVARRIGVAHGVTGVELAVARSIALGVEGDAALVWLDELVDLENARIAARDGVPARVVTDDGDRRADLGWCWGAAGVAVARQVVAEVRPTRAAMLPIERARVLSVSRSLSSVRACCGTTGQLRAAPPDDPATSGLLAALRSSELRFESDTRHRNPGVWRGISGVGLELLRRSGAGPTPDPLTFAPIEPAGRRRRAISHHQSPAVTPEGAVR